MPVFTLVIGPHGSGQRETLFMQATDVAEVIAYVERQSDTISAEIWLGERLLFSVDSSPDTGKVWMVNPRLRDTTNEDEEMS